MSSLLLHGKRYRSAKSRASGGLVDKYEKALSEEMAKRQRLYSGGDLTEFPDF
uniref:ATP synthase peripheral stalk subunit F6, mitochondrial n=1 Tax=Oncorhynchus kisutch TaxID=8019 RepID=A0A8C7FUR5_ONCKI